uniref:Uncharacterized protein n=1 Tax=Anguilla anguilla TaxID=7936 RepID=A0A0E9QR53_ANGAN
MRSKNQSRMSFQHYGICKYEDDLSIT